MPTTIKARFVTFNTTEHDALSIMLGVIVYELACICGYSLVMAPPLIAILLAFMAFLLVTWHALKHWRTPRAQRFNIV